MRTTLFGLVAILIISCSEFSSDTNLKKDQPQLIASTELFEEPILETAYPSLGEMVGQMIIVGYRGTDIKNNLNLVNSIKENRVGGIIIYEKNIPTPNSKIGLQRIIQTFQEYNKKKLFIGIDQEGGTVNRLKTKYGFPKSVTVKSLGDIDNSDSTKKYANSMAKTLNQLGINLNFAPCVDLCSNPNNPIIAKYGRCFSDNPALVVKHSKVFIEALNENKVVSVMKHFPGHGSSSSDSHKGMVNITNQWNESELIPYKELKNVGNANAIMTAHIINKKLDNSALPATLSSKIIGDLLRGKLEYNGVIFSDDMHMKAISTYYGLKNAIELSINAGVDVLMFSGNIEGVNDNTADEIHRLILTLIKEGKITEDRIKESYQRITRLKSQI